MYYIYWRPADFHILFWLLLNLNFFSLSRSFLFIRAAISRTVGLLDHVRILINSPWSNRVSRNPHQTQVELSCILYISLYYYYYYYYYDYYFIFFSSSSSFYFILQQQQISQIWIQPKMRESVIGAFGAFRRTLIIYRDHKSCGNFSKERKKKMKILGSFSFIFFSF